MKDKIKLGLKSIGVLFILLFFSSFFFVILNIDTNNIQDINYLIYLSISNLIVLGIFIKIYYKTLLDDFRNFKAKYLLTSLKYWFIGLIIMIMSNLIITFILNKQISGNEEIVRNLVKVSPFLMLLDTSIYAPITEELTFRKSIKDFISNKYLYIITSGLIFGLLHIINHINNISDLVYLIPYSALGICFAITYYKTNNIYSTILIHSFHNTMAVILFLIGAAL